MNFLGEDYPIVTSVAKAVEYLKQGRGVGLETRWMPTPQEAEAAFDALRQFQATGIRRKDSNIIFLVINQQ